MKSPKFIVSIILFLSMVGVSSLLVAQPSAVDGPRIGGPGFGGSVILTGDPMLGNGDIDREPFISIPPFRQHKPFSNPPSMGSEGPVIGVRRDPSVEFPREGEPTLTKYGEKLARFTPTTPIETKKCDDAIKAYTEEGDPGRRDPYIEACFRESSSPVTSNLSGIVVSVIFKNGTACHGAILNSNYVLTARHCLLTESEFHENPQSSLHKEWLDKVTLYKAKADRKAVGVQGTLKLHFDPFSPYSRLSSEEQKKLAELRTSRPRALDYVLLRWMGSYDGIGNSNYVPVASRGDVDLLAEPQALTLGAIVNMGSGMTLYPDDTPTCVVKRVSLETRHLIHNCQALPGMSGTPIFIRPNRKYEPELKLLAVHVGVAGDIDPSIRIRGNEAVIPPMELLQSPEQNGNIH